MTIRYVTVLALGICIGLVGAGFLKSISMAQIGIADNNARIIGVRVGRFNFTRTDFGADRSFLEDADTGRVLVPPSIYIYKVQGQLVYGVRREEDKADDLVGVSKTTGHPASFPNNIYFVIDVGKNDVKYYSDRTYATEIEIDVYYD